MTLRRLLVLGSYNVVSSLILGRVWCADLLMDVDMWWGSCEVCVVQVGVLCPERSRFTHSGEDVSGLAGEAIMLCMEPLCVRMMQLASFTLSFT
jgi:hypothetical protein